MRVILFICAGLSLLGFVDAFFIPFSFSLAIFAAICLLSFTVAFGFLAIIRELRAKN